MLHAVGFVGGLDVHKGHGGGLAVFIFVVTKDLDALDSPIPFEVFLDAVLPYVLREVAHPEMSGLADHGGRGGQPKLILRFEAASSPLGGGRLLQSRGRGPSLKRLYCNSHW